MTFLAKQIKKQTLQTNMMRNLVPTISRSCDATAATYISSEPTSCRSQHINVVNNTHSQLLSALNRRTNQFLFSNPTIAASFQVENQQNMSASNTSPQTSSASTGRVKFQWTPNSAVNSKRSSNEGPTTPNLELSKEEGFESNLTQLFTKGFLAVLTS